MVSSFFGLAKHIAHFYDERGDFAGSKTICWTFTNSKGMKKTTFDYDHGTYNINCEASRGYTGHFLVDEFVYTYTINNCDPWKISKNGHPLMNPKIYKKRLTNRFVEQLHEAGKVSSLADLITPRNIIIVLVAIGVLYYISTGGALLPNG